MQFLKITMALCLTQLLCLQMCLTQVGLWEQINGIAEGKRVAWTPDSLTVTQRSDKTVQLAKSDLAQISLVAGKSRGAGAGREFLIAGGVRGAVLAAAMRSEGSAAGFFLAGLLRFGGVAAGIAALFPAHEELTCPATPAAEP